MSGPHRPPNTKSKKTVSDDGNGVNKNQKMSVFEELLQGCIPCAPRALPLAREVPRHPICDYLDSDVLLSKDEHGNLTECVASEALSGKVVAIYFSALWSPECQKFTPVLIEAYRALMERNKSFAIIFLSSDRNEAAFEEYFKEMPWMALHFQDRNTITVLSKKFKVSGVPTLVLIDERGAVITKDGWDSVREDPQGHDFPWRPKTPLELLSPQLLIGNQKKTASEPLLKGKFLALLFSAEWSLPCQTFSVMLEQLYRSMKISSDHENFEFVLISCDRDEAGFRRHYRDMPWAALPWAGSKNREALSKMYSVKSIPCLITISPDGATINKHGREAACDDPQGVSFPWHPFPHPVTDCGSGVNSLGHNINDKPSLIVLCDGLVDDAADKWKEEVTAALLPVAQEVADASVDTEDGPELLFFTGNESSGVAIRLRDLMGLEKAPYPQMVLLDIPDGGAFYVAPRGAVNESAVRVFIERFCHGTLKRRQLAR